MAPLCAASHFHIFWSQHWIAQDDLNLPSCRCIEETHHFSCTLNFCNDLLKWKNFWHSLAKHCFRDGLGKWNGSKVEWVWLWAWYFYLLVTTLDTMSHLSLSQALLYDAWWLQFFGDNEVRLCVQAHVFAYNLALGWFEKWLENLVINYH